MALAITLCELEFHKVLQKPLLYPFQNCSNTKDTDSRKTFSTSVTHFSAERAPTYSPAFGLNRLNIAAAVEVRDCRFTLFVPPRTKS